MICTKCGFENREGELLCRQCGTVSSSLDGMNHPGVTTRVIIVEDAPVVETGTILMVAFVVAGHSHDFPVKNGDSILIGRGMGQSTSGIALLDLARAGGADKGVSRKHAVVNIHDHQALVSDLNSTNGTYLNRRRLTPTVRYQISNYDVLRLGMLEISIKVY